MSLSLLSLMVAETLSGFYSHHDNLVALFFICAKCFCCWHEFTKSFDYLDPLVFLDSQQRCHSMLQSRISLGLNQYLCFRSQSMSLIERFY